MAPTTTTAEEKEQERENNLYWPHKSVCSIRIIRSEIIANTDPNEILNAHTKPTDCGKRARGRGMRNSIVKFHWGKNRLKK